MFNFFEKSPPFLFDLGCSCFFKASLIGEDSEYQGREQPKCPALQPCFWPFVCSIGHSLGPDAERGAAGEIRSGTEIAPSPPLRLYSLRNLGYQKASAFSGLLVVFFPPPSLKTHKYLGVAFCSWQAEGVFQVVKILQGHGIAGHAPGAPHSEIHG